MRVVFNGDDGLLTVRFRRDECDLGGGTRGLLLPCDGIISTKSKNIQRQIAKNVSEMRMQNHLENDANSNAKLRKAKQKQVSACVGLSTSKALARRKQFDTKSWLSAGCRLVALSPNTINKLPKRLKGHQSRTIVPGPKILITKWQNW